MKQGSIVNLGSEADQLISCVFIGDIYKMNYQHTKDEEAAPGIKY
jgi:hypothetical protein